MGKGNAKLYTMACNLLAELVTGYQRNRKWQINNQLDSHISRETKANCGFWG